MDKKLLSNEYSYSLNNVRDWPFQIIHKYGDLNQRTVSSMSLQDLIKAHPGLLQIHSEESNIERKANLVIKYLHKFNKHIYKTWHNEATYAKRAISKEIAERIFVANSITEEELIALMKSPKINLKFSLIKEPEELLEEAIRFGTCISGKSHNYLNHSINDEGQINIKITYEDAPKGYARFIIIKDDLQRKNILIQYAAVIDKPVRLIHEALSAFAVEIAKKSNIYKVLSAEKEKRYLSLDENKNASGKFRKIGLKQFNKARGFVFDGKTIQNLSVIYRNNSYL